MHGAVAVTFTVEDGTGLDDANAYVSVEDATAYLALRGRDGEAGWDEADTGDLEAAIIRATDYVEARFRGRWRGTKATAAQSLAWPRLDAYDDDGFEISPDAVPPALAAAVTEYAVRALAGDLLPDPAPPGDNTSGRVVRLMEKVGDLQTDTTYADSQRLPAGELRQYPAADLMIARLIHGGGMFGRVGRA